MRQGCLLIGALRRGVRFLTGAVRSVLDDCVTVLTQCALRPSEIDRGGAEV